MKTRIQTVRESIENTLKHHGKKVGSVRIVLASKYASSLTLSQSIQGGITIVGDNTIKAALENRENEDFHDGISHHLIGHLQTNKAKKAVKIFTCIQSLDSTRLADALNKELIKSGEQIDVLVQVNVSGEDQKKGVLEEDLERLVDHVMSTESLNIKGLMTMPPYTENPENNREYFRKLREIRDGLERKFGVSLSELSMGTSQDFLVAIEEGATLVRLGKVLFSPYFFDQVMENSK